MITNTVNFGEGRSFFAGRKIVSASSLYILKRGLAVKIKIIAFKSRNGHFSFFPRNLETAARVFFTTLISLYPY